MTKKFPLPGELDTLCQFILKKERGKPHEWGFMMVETNEELVKRIQAGQDVQQNLCRLWQQNSGLLHKLTAKYLPGEEADGLQQSFFAVRAAASHYDADSGTPFCVYLALWTKAELLRYRTECALVRVPEYKNTLLRKVNRIQQEFTQCCGSAPDLLTLADLAGMTVADLDALRMAERAAAAAESLDKPLMEAGEAVTLADVLPARETADAEILEEIEQAESAKALREWLERMDINGIVQRRWLDGLSWAEIAAEYGMTVTECKREETAVMRKLRNPRYQRDILPRLPEWCQSMAYRGSLSAFRRTSTSATERTALKLVDG